MSAGGETRTYKSYIEFYQTVYGGSLKALIPAGRTGAAMFLAEQDAGDWSDAATPDLVITVPIRHTGKGIIDVGAGRFHVDGAPPDSFVVGAPDYATTILIDEPSVLRSLALPYAKLRLLCGDESELPEDGDFGRLHRGPQHDGGVVLLMEQIWREGAQGSPNGALWADGALLQVLAALLRLREPAARQGREGLAPWQVRRVADFIEADLAADLGLAELAALVGVSTFHLCRGFRQATGLPPNRWRTARRMERARELLAETAVPVADVATAVGYDDPGYFARVFRRETGAAPLAYRRDRRS